MKADQTLPNLQELLNTKGTPEIVVIHCGANDLGLVPGFTLRKHLCIILGILRDWIPTALIVWSQMLPRLSWREIQPPSIMNKTRCRVNREVASFVLKLGGAYIKYKDICVLNRQLFLHDGVHLSEIGNGIFLNVLQSALEVFLSSEARVFP